MNPIETVRWPHWHSLLVVARLSSPLQAEVLSSHPAGSQAEEKTENWWSKAASSSSYPPVVQGAAKINECGVWQTNRRPHNRAMSAEANWANRHKLTKLNDEDDKSDTNTHLRRVKATHWLQMRTQYINLYQRRLVQLRHAGNNVTCNFYHAMFLEARCR